MASSPEEPPPGAAATHPQHQHGAPFKLDLEDAFRPDRGTEDMFQVKDNKFAFTPGHLGKLFNPKNYNTFYSLGGLKGLEKGLQTDRSTGLSVDETNAPSTVTFSDAARPDAIDHPIDDAPQQDASAATPPAHTARDSQGGHYVDRLRVFSENRLPERPPKTIPQLLWANYNDKVLQLLTAAAVISLALGIYQTVGVPAEDGEAKVEWVEGVAIVVAIVIVVFVGTVNDFRMERKFRALNKKNDSRNIKVIRSGKSQEISVYDIVVGDVVHLSPGDLVPVDGIFISGHGVKCDESSATGESDLLKKTAADEVYAALERGDYKNIEKLDPFIISGAKVSEGTGTFLVTAVGVNSCYGRISMSLREDPGPTPLQVKLNGLADSIAKYGGGAALLLFVVLFIRFLANLPGNNASPADKGQLFLTLFITAVTVVVVAVPEGLPLAVTLALSFATSRMLKDNNLVRILRAVETGGNATTICSDKTGTLTTNRMTVTAATISKSLQFTAGNGPAQSETEKTATGSKENVTDSSASNFASSLGARVKELIIQANAINSTAFEGEDNGVKTFIGSKTETALLEFCRDHLGAGPVHEDRANADVVQVVPFDSAVKYMATVIRLPDGTFRAYAKGASEILLANCSNIISNPATENITTAPLDQGERKELEDIINSYASQSLRTIAVSYRDFPSWPPKDAVDPEDSNMADFNAAHKDMTLVGIFGIKDPLRPGVADAVKRCQGAGIVVRMVTGDNILTAQAIAKECGILTEGGIAIEGPAFRRLEHDELVDTVKKLRVMARSSPDDKKLLVSTLKELGETVAVTGDGTNDAPALKMADVGFSMGIAGTEVAKEASAIVLMDDNFVSVVRAVEWGRTVNDAVKKFLQFQLTVNITAVALTFISAVASKDQESVLNAVQLLWVNLIMDTLAALALATDPPSPHVLDRPPEKKSDPLITINMGKMIIGQAIFQLVITLILHFAGMEMKDVLGLKLNKDLSPDKQHENMEDQLKSLVFNTFVWMQIFNELNNRRLDNKFNIFEGIQRNYFFIGINFIMVGGQILIVFFGGEAFKLVRLNPQEWGVSILLGFLSIPMGILIRCIPDAFAYKLVCHLRKLIPHKLLRKFGKKKKQKKTQTDIEAPTEDTQAVDHLNDSRPTSSQGSVYSSDSEPPADLRWIRSIRGGRVSTFSSQVYTSRREKMKRKVEKARDKMHV